MGLIRGIRRSFWRGVAALLPALLTVIVLVLGISFVHNYFGQYVNRAIVYVPRHEADTDLADVAHAVAETLVEKSQRLTPPDELRDLHPHFLLVLENAERAFHYLSQSDDEKADRHMAVVRDEIRIMRQIQREIGIEIPELAL